MKPRSSHLLFNNRFLFEDYPTSSEKDFTLKTRFPWGIVTPSPHTKDSSSSFKPLSLKKITFSPVTSALVPKARSHYSLMPKTKVHRDLFCEKAFPSVRITYSLLLEIFPSEFFLFHTLKQDYTIYLLRIFHLLESCHQSFHQKLLIFQNPSEKSLEINK